MRLLPSTEVHEWNILCLAQQRDLTLCRKLGQFSGRIPLWCLDRIAYWLKKDYVVTSAKSVCDQVDFDQSRSLIFEEPSDRTLATLSFLVTFAKLRKTIVSFVMPIFPSTSNNSAPTGRIFKKFDIWVFSQKPIDKIQVSLKSYKNSGYFTWRLKYTYDHISLSSS